MQVKPIHLIPKAATRLRASSIGRVSLPPQGPHRLAGDRCIEWEWVLRHLPDPPARILDVGCVDSVTAGMAAVRGLEVTGVDLRPNPFLLPGLTCLQSSIEDAGIDHISYDCIVLCSTLEHIGLGGRYGETSSEGADTRTIQRLAGLLTADGRLVVTIPVGISAVFAPFHRVYGEKDVATLFRGLTVAESAFWKKMGARWTPVDSSEAFATPGADDYYAIGLYVLHRECG